MAGGQTDRLCRQLRTLMAAENSAVSDRELLERFCLRRDEAAFEALVLRHGPMVLRVCRGALGDDHLAEDAFQATFLVLVRKAAAVRKAASAASWLYKVAYRVALRARASDARRRRLEAQAPRPEAAPPDDPLWRDVRAVLDEELQRLPEKYQAPLVLCCLEGLARDEAAQRLGWSPGALKGRLERGREALRARLTRRGVALSGALGAALLPEGATRAAVPVALTEATVRSAGALAAGGQAAGVIPPRAGDLARGVARAMTLARLKVVAALLLVTVPLAAAARGILTGDEPQAQRAQEARPADAGPARPALGRVDRYGDPLPTDAVARLGTNRFRHMHTISGLAFSADGKKVLSGSWDNTVRLWDAATGKELCRLSGSKDSFSSVAVSPDGALLAGGDMHRTLYIWDAATGKELRRVENLENTVFGLRFAPDGKSLAGLSGDTVRVWDAATGAELRRLKGPKQDMRPFAISPDLKTFAAGLDGGSLLLWDLTTGKETRRIPSGQADLSCLAFSPDGTVLASGGGKDDRTVRLWDCATGRRLHHFGPDDGWIDSLAFAPDGQRVAVGQQTGAVAVNDLSTGKELYRCGLREGTWVRGLVFSPDGKTLAAGGTDDRAIHFFDAETGKERMPFAGHQNEVVVAVVSVDGKGLVSAGKDGVVCVWDLATGTEARRWSVGRRGVAAVALAPDGRGLAVAADKALSLWDTATEQEVRRFVGHKGTPGAVAFSPDGKTLASGAWEDHTIRLWDVATGAERLQIKLPMPNGHNYGDVPLAFADGGKVLISGSADRANPSFYFWEAATGRELRRIQHPVSRLALSADGKVLATTGWDRHVRLWDVASGEKLADVPTEAEALAFSPDGRLLAYGGTGGVVHLWEVSTGQERRQFAGHQPGRDDRGTFAAGVAVLAFSPDGGTLISGGGDTTLLLWDVYGAGRHAQARPGPAALAGLWDDLSAGAARADDAVGALIAARSEAVSFLKGRLHAARPCDPRRLARLIADLDSEDFEARERAARELGQMSESAAPELRKALTASPSAEARRALEDVLQRLEGRPTGEALAALRAVEVLEHIASPEALEVLRALAEGVPEARLTREGRAAVERLARRPPTTKP
jgi:RNA polymerase sigma factor (sigma-70 family)